MKRKSGWYRHPEKGLVWYDARTNSFRSKFGGPVREALSIGYRHSKLKDAVAIADAGGKIAKKIWPHIVEGTTSYSDYQEKLRKSNNQIIDEAIETQIEEWVPSVDDDNIKDNRSEETQEKEKVEPIETKPKEKTPKVPVLFESNKTIDFSYISNPQNREIAKSLHRQLNETKASIVGEYFT